MKMKKVLEAVQFDNEKGVESYNTKGHRTASTEVQDGPIPHASRPAKRKTVDLASMIGTFLPTSSEFSWTTEHVIIF